MAEEITVDTTEAEGIVQTPTTESGQGAGGGMSFTANDIEQAAQEIAAAEQAATALPEGVTPEMVESLRASGYSVSEPNAAAASTAPVDPETASKTPEDMAAALATQVPEVFTPEHMAQYSAEFSKEGALGEESRAALKKAHKIDDGVLDMVLEGIRAKSDMLAVDALSQLGVKWGDFEQWANWSVDNEAESVRAARQEQLQSKDADVRNAALRSLQAAASAGRTNEPTALRGGMSSPALLSGKNFEESLNVALNDPRYHRTDAVGDAYRENIYRALENKTES